MTKSLALAIALVAAALSGCGGDARSGGAAGAVAGAPSGVPADASEAMFATLDGVDVGTLDARRIVTVGGPVTETVYALGLGGRVVGTDASSLYPDEILALPRLDYFRAISAEGVLSLSPTLVLAVEGTGPPGVVEQIRAAGVPVLVTPEVSTVEGAERRLLALGRVLDAEDAAISLASTLRDEVAAAEALRPRPAPRALFVYARGAGTLLVSGTGNPADAVLRLAGARNVVDAFEGYQPLTAEAVAGAAPDVIVLPTKSLESIGGLDGLFALPGLAQTPAAATRRVVTVDDALLLSFGPRLGEAVAELARELSASAEPAAE